MTGNRVQTLDLSSSVNSDWVDNVDDRNSMSIRVAFAAADVVGTIGVQSYPAQAVGFKDETDTAQTTLAVTSALDGTSHEFVIAPCPRGRYRVVFSHTSDGSADSAVVVFG